MENPSVCSGIVAGGEIPVQGEHGSEGGQSGHQHGHYEMFGLHHGSTLFQNTSKFYAQTRSLPYAVSSLNKL